MAVSTISPPPFGLDLLHGKHFGLVCASQRGDRFSFYPELGCTRGLTKNTAGWNLRTPEACNVGEPSWLLFMTSASFKLAEFFSEKVLRGEGPFIAKTLLFFPWQVTGPTPSCQPCPNFPFWWLTRSYQRERRCIWVMCSQQLSPFPIQIFPGSKVESFKTIGNIGTTPLPRGRHLVLWREEAQWPFAFIWSCLLFQGLGCAVKGRHTFSSLQSCWGDLFYGLQTLVDYDSFCLKICAVNELVAVMCKWVSYAVVTWLKNLVITFLCLVSQKSDFLHPFIYLSELWLWIVRETGLVTLRFIFGSD